LLSTLEIHIDSGDTYYKVLQFVTSKFIRSLGLAYCNTEKPLQLHKHKVYPNKLTTSY